MRGRSRSQAIPDYKAKGYKQTFASGSNPVATPAMKIDDAIPNNLTAQKKVSANRKNTTFGENTVGAAESKYPPQTEISKFYENKNIEKTPT